MLLTEKRLRALIQGVLLEAYEEDKMKLSSLVQSLPDTGTGNPDTSPKNSYSILVADRNKVRWVKWLAKHFLNVSSSAAGDSLEDALPLLAGYSKILQGVSDRYLSKSPKNEPFKKAVDELLRGRNPAAFENLKLTEIDAIKRLYELPPDKIGISRTDTSWEQDKIGQFGTWDLYFPTNQQNSVNIAGFDPDTHLPYVTWCTARTAGSNLFNLYATQGTMLFYAIDRSKEPTDPKSRISIGFMNGTLQAAGKENGVTVDGANKGLTLEDLSHIFGSNLGVNLNSKHMPDDYDDDDQRISVDEAAYEHSKFSVTGGILGAAHKIVAQHGGTHPIVSEVKTAGSDVEKFDQMMQGLSTSEAAELVSYILEHATDVVFRHAAAHKSDKVKGVVARFREAPRDVLESLYRYAKVKGDKDMMREFSRNTSVPDVLVDMLENFFDADDKVKPIVNTEIRTFKEILFNRGLPADVLDEALRSLINNNLAFFNSKLASDIPEIIRDREMNPDTMKLIWDKMDMMVKDNNNMGVYHFANHPNIHSDVLYDMLMGHRFEPTVCARIVNNPNADKRTIDGIGRDALLRPAFLWGNRGVLARALADNDLTPVEVLKYIADADVDDRYIHIKTSAKNKLNARSPQVAEARRMALRIIAELKRT